MLCSVTSKMNKQLKNAWMKKVTSKPEIKVGQIKGAT